MSVEIIANSNLMSIIMEAGVLKGMRYEISYETICSDLQCTCGEMTIRATGDNSVHILLINGKTKTIKPLSSSLTPKEDKLFCKSFLKEFDNKLWDIFYYNFHKIKNDRTNSLDLFSEVSYDFPNEYAIDSNGATVPYTNVIPYSDKYIVNYKNTEFMVFDNYCVSTTCNCRTVILDFMDITDTRTKPKSLFVINYSYLSGKFELLEDSTEIEEKEMKKYVSSLNSVHPKLNNDLKTRHRLLRKLYTDFKNNHDFQIVEPTYGEKIGRNDSCPCGSGKKYKKCCG